MMLGSPEFQVANSVAKEVLIKSSARPELVEG